MPYSLEYLSHQKTIRFTRYGELKEESSNKRVYLKHECVVEERIDGIWQITEVYIPA